LSRVVISVLALSLLSACSITQTIDPVSQLGTNEVCIIENPPVREGFLVELQRNLRSKGADVRVIDPGASVAACPVVVTYLARWSWDLTIYMSYAEIVVYEDGARAGRALYDATKGGGRLDKFVDAEPKIRELVDQLFPTDFATR